MYNVRHAATAAAAAAVAAAAEYLHRKAVQCCKRKSLWPHATAVNKY